MKPEEIAKKYVFGNHDALTDRQEIKDMILDIENYAKEYHAEQLELTAVIYTTPEFCEHHRVNLDGKVVEYCKKCKKILHHYY